MNSSAFRSRWNEDGRWKLRSSTGREFHMDGPATANLRGPQRTVLVAGTARSRAGDNGQRYRRPADSLTGSWVLVIQTIKHQRRQLKVHSLPDRKPVQNVPYCAEMDDLTSIPIRYRKTFFPYLSIPITAAVVSITAINPRLPRYYRCPHYRAGLYFGPTVLPIQAYYFFFQKLFIDAQQLSDLRYKEKAMRQNNNNQ